jgi:hypothetical protein
MALVLILAAQSVQLFRGVIYKKFGIQETWDDSWILHSNFVSSGPSLYYVTQFYKPRYVNSYWPP